MRYVAGGRVPQEGMRVDYADVLRQAVENERWRVLRAVSEAIELVPVTKPGRDYGTDNIPGVTVRRDILAAIKRIEDER